MKEKVLFDVKLQEPGKVNDRKIEFKEAGDYTIQCAIHPKMKIKVTVD
jgi:plastocyanin